MKKLRGLRDSAVFLCFGEPEIKIAFCRIFTQESS